MSIYLNITQVRNQLLTNKIVYTLRERKRKHLGKSQIRIGSYRQSKTIGKCRISFVKSINDDKELKQYLHQSGFTSIEDWRHKSGRSIHLYRVELL